MEPFHPLVEEPIDIGEEDETEVIEPTHVDEDWCQGISVYCYLTFKSIRQWIIEMLLTLSQHTGYIFLCDISIQISCKSALILCIPH